MRLRHWPIIMLWVYYNRTQRFKVNLQDVYINNYSRDLCLCLLDQPSFPDSLIFIDFPVKTRSIRDFTRFLCRYVQAPRKQQACSFFCNRWGTWALLRYIKPSTLRFAVPRGLTIFHFRRKPVCSTPLPRCCHRSKVARAWSVIFNLFSASHCRPELGSCSSNVFNDQ